MAFFRDLRAEADQALAGCHAGRYGKPYPYGYCREITRDVLNRLRAKLGQPACHGAKVLANFLHAGGKGRCVWGVLRGRYFQTALQFGALYVDVANDTVVPSKPAVEILPMAEAGLEAVRDGFHFAAIAEAYWGVRIYGNHVLPALAPVVPMIGVTQDGTVMLQSLSGYMVGLFQQDGFRRAMEWLAAAHAPPEWACAILRTHARPAISVPVGGCAEAALAACRAAREQGLASNEAWLTAMLADVTRLHAALPTMGAAAATPDRPQHA